MKYWDGGGLVPWWKFLSPSCVNQFAPVINDTHCSHVSSIGFLPFCQTLKYTKWSEKIDLDWKRFCSLKNVEYDDDAYHVSSSSHSRVNATVLKYDKLCPPNISEKEFWQDIFDLKLFFAPLRDKCSILARDDVKVNPDAVPGYILSKFFGIRNKEEACSYMLDYIDYFWNYSHHENYPWLWKQSGKVEMLKKAKLDKDDIRGFTIIPFEAFVYTARLCQDMNEKMCEKEFISVSPIKHGINLSRGGFRSLIRELSHGLSEYDVIEGDCVKWDSGMLDNLFEAILHIRYFCWDKKGMDEQEWWLRMRYSYSNIRESFIGLTTGQVVQKMFGNPSGQTSTTDDNCIGHLFVLCHAWRKLYNRSLFFDYHRKVNIALYADDHVICAEKSLNFGSFPLRRAEYNSLGCDLSPEKDLVTSDFEGHTFLGLTARWHPDLKLFVPTFSRVRALNTLSKYESRYSIEQVFDRASVILYLTCFDDLTFSQVYAYCEYLRMQYPVQLSFRKLISRNACQSFWLCREQSDSTPSIEIGGLDGDKNFVDAWLRKIRHRVSQIKKNC